MEKKHKLARQVHTVKQAFYEFNDGSNRILLSVTDWWNGEGFDINYSIQKGSGSENSFTLSYDEFRALIRAVKQLIPYVTSPDRARVTIEFEELIGKGQNTLLAETTSKGTAVSFKYSNSGSKVKSLVLTWPELKALRNGGRMLQRS